MTNNMKSLSLSFSLFILSAKYLVNNAEYIDCRTKTCYKSDIVCPNNQNCIIDCAYYPGDYDEACQDSKIYCPDNAKCTVICDCKEACDRAFIYAQSSTELNITCKSHEESCYSLDIYCPQITNPTQPSCIIYGDDSRSDTLRYMEIYAWNGLNDISFTASSTLPSSYPITVNCESDWGSSCYIDRYNPWQNCQSGGDSICDYVPTPYPSKTPTKFPSETPTKSPSHNPSISPTNIPTVSPSNPSVSPTEIPSIFPSTNPSGIPSISPTVRSSIPTLNPTESPEGNQNGAASTTKVTNAGIIEDETGSDSMSGSFLNDLEILIIIILIFLFCCVLSILCICLVHNRATRKELKLVREQIASIELKQKQRKTTTNYDGNISIESNKNNEQTDISMNNKARFISQSMVNPSEMNQAKDINHRMHQSVSGMNRNSNINGDEGIIKHLTGIHKLSRVHSMSSPSGDEDGYETGNVVMNINTANDDYDQDGIEEESGNELYNEMRDEQFMETPMTPMDTPQHLNDD